MATYDRDYDRDRDRDRDYTYRREREVYGPAVRRKGASMDWLWWVIGLAILIIAAIVLIPLFT